MMQAKKRREVFDASNLISLTKKSSKERESFSASTRTPYVGYRRPMEVDVELGETTVLRGTVAALEAAHGEASGL